LQFLKSLFCFHGFDNRTRFFAIYSTVFVVFIMFSSAFSSKFFIAVAVIVLFTPILSLTTLRRLKDAKIHIKWLAAPTVLFILITFFIIFTKQNNYYLLFIPALYLAALLTYPSVSKKNSAYLKYILGYFGPVDMTEYQQTTHQGNQKKRRIEPSLAGNNSEANHSTNYHGKYDQTENYKSNNLAELNNNNQSIYQDNQNTEKTSNNQHKDLGELIRLNILNNKKTQLTIAIIVIIILVRLCASWLMTYFQNNNIPETEKPIQLITSSQSMLERKYPLAMPDNFSLFLSQHQGIIINWQADEVNTSTLWSQTSAVGDSSCQQISFNKGNPIRTLLVQVETDPAADSTKLNNYFASFSPLDSKALIQALAFRGSFTLCGYDFSLKGSQATLGKSKQYADWISY